MREFYKINDRDISEADMQMQAPMGAAGEVPENALPSGTDRLVTNPRSSEQVAAF